ncbi:MAG: diguanylate cyclase, partial [Spirochaetota bacterium]|nr:diguanylate cyclase [Spirochaetota bacterium]
KLLMNSRMQRKLINHFYNNPKSLFILGGFFLAIIFSVIRYIAGPEYDFSFFYFLPITLISWYSGMLPGILLSLFCSIGWFIFDLLLLNTHTNFSAAIVNEIFRGILFIYVAVIISLLKDLLRRERKSARIDHLTQIANRRSFYEYAKSEINRSHRYKLDFTIIFMDIDNFKSINDSYGHHTGDKLLCVVANTIKNNIRVNDLVARLGGDEFAIVLPNLQSESAGKLAHKLQQTLLETMLKNNWPVTFSIGVSTFNKALPEIDEIIRRVDHLMYSAKLSGKNRIIQEMVSE